MVSNQWHKWFAWKPVKDCHGNKLLLKTIERYHYLDWVPVKGVYIGSGGSDCYSNIKPIEDR